MNKKILFLINNLNLGGAENVFVDQANYLAENGFHVYFGVLTNTNKANALICISSWRLPEYVPSGQHQDFTIFWLEIMTFFTLCSACLYYYLISSGTFMGYDDRCKVIK